jgi:GH25 family lysozyme M1 (1,4-beta-N-acetylmuramidase)
MLREQINKFSAFVLDASRYQVKIDGEILKRNNVAAVILKASGGVSKDVRFDTHYEELRWWGIPTPAYHWLDPILTPQRNVDFFLSVTAGKDVPFYVLDIEQWWNCWAKWGEAQARKIAWNLVPRIAPNRINAHAFQSAQYLRSRTKKPVVIYTSRGFVMSYAPGMAEWIGDFDLWVANYVLRSDKKIFTTWDELYKRYLPTGVPVLPRGTNISRLRGWQYSGDLVGLPGIYADDRKTRLSMLDLNIFDPRWLNDYSYPAPQLPLVTPKPVYYRVSNWVTRGLNFRTQAAANASVITVLRAGTQLEASGRRVGDWLEVRWSGKTGFVHQAYVEKV